MGLHPRGIGIGGPQGPAPLFYSRQCTKPYKHIFIHTECALLCKSEPVMVHTYYHSSHTIILYSGSLYT